MIQELTIGSVKSRKHRWVALAAVGVLGIPLFLRFGGSAKPAVAPAIKVSVAAAPVVREDMWREEAFDAEFRPYQEIDLHAKVTGFLEKITVDIGDQVKAGQLI